MERQLHGHINLNIYKTYYIIHNGRIVNEIKKWEKQLIILPVWIISEGIDIESYNLFG